MANIKLNPLIESIGPLKGGYKPDSLKIKGKIEEALVKQGMDKVKATKLAKKFRSGSASALSKKEAIKVAQAFKGGGLFKYGEKDITGQVGAQLRAEKRQTEKETEGGNEKKKALVRERQAMERVWQQNRQTQGLTNQAAAGATPSFGQPTFAAPLPPTSLAANNQLPAVAYPQTAAPVANNYGNKAYQQPAPVAATNESQATEPSDLQID